MNASQTIYKNYQKLTLQETPGSVPAGRLPRHKEVILLHDLIDCARPGEEVEVTGQWTPLTCTQRHACDARPQLDSLQERWVPSLSLSKQQSTRLHRDGMLLLPGACLCDSTSRRVAVWCPSLCCAAAVRIAGIYCSGYDTQLNAKNGFPVFSTHIEANYISKSTDAWNVYKLTDEDRQRITALAADPRISECMQTEQAGCQPTQPHMHTITAPQHSPTELILEPENGVLLLPPLHQGS